MPHEFLDRADVLPRHREPRTESVSARVRRYVSAEAGRRPGRIRRRPDVPERLPRAIFETGFGPSYRPKSIIRL
jgi:hypothetical protein